MGYLLSNLDKNDYKVCQMDLVHHNHVLNLLEKTKKKNLSYVSIIFCITRKDFFGV